MTVLTVNWLRPLFLCILSTFVRYFNKFLLCLLILCISQQVGTPPARKPTKASGTAYFFPITLPLSSLCELVLYESYSEQNIRTLFVNKTEPLGPAAAVAILAEGT